MPHDQLVDLAGLGAQRRVGAGELRRVDGRVRLWGWDVGVWRGGAVTRPVPTQTSIRPKAPKGRKTDNNAPVVHTQTSKLQALKNRQEDRQRPATARHGPHLVVLGARPREDEAALGVRGVPVQQSRGVGAPLRVAALLVDERPQVLLRLEFFRLGAGVGDVAGIGFGGYGNGIGMMRRRRRRRGWVWIAAT